MNVSEYAALDAVGLADLIRRGEVSRREVLATAIAALKEAHRELNCVLEIYEERVDGDAAANARGALAGVPFLLKDLGASEEGRLQEMGSRLAQGYRASHNTDLTRRYKEAGLVILGRSTTPELGYNCSTETSAAGRTRNPWNTEHTPGGSSGGSAAAVACGAVPVAHASDGGGSIRIPACWSGLVGLKPTRMRNPVGPDFGDLLLGMACEHVVSRTVRDSAAVLDATNGPGVGDTYEIARPVRPYLEETRTSPGHLRVGVLYDPWTEADPLDPEVRAALDRTRALLAELGHDVAETSLVIDAEMFTVMNARAWCSLLPLFAGQLALVTGRRPGPDTLDAAMLACLEFGTAMSASDLQEALLFFNLLCRTVGPLFQSFDVLATPTCVCPPPKLGVLDPTRSGYDAIGWTRHMFHLTPYTATFNVTGNPAISLPLEQASSGLPIGVQFVGRFADEATLFRLASQLEEARPWRDRRPAFHVASRP